METCRLLRCYVLARKSWDDTLVDVHAHSQSGLRVTLPRWQWRFERPSSDAIKIYEDWLASEHRILFPKASLHGIRLASLDLFWASHGMNIVIAATKVAIKSLLARCEKAGVSREQMGRVMVAYGIDATKIEAYVSTVVDVVEWLAAVAHSMNDDEIIVLVSTEGASWGQSERR